MKTTEEILEHKLSKYDISHDTWYIDGNSETYKAIYEAMRVYADQFKQKWIPITLNSLPDIDQPVLLADKDFDSFLASSLSKNGFFTDSPYEWETGFDMPAPFDSYAFWQPIIK